MNGRLCLSRSSGWFGWASDRNQGELKVCKMQILSYTQKALSQGQQKDLKLKSSRGHDSKCFMTQFDAIFLCIRYEVTPLRKL